MAPYLSNNTYTSLASHSLAILYQGFFFSGINLTIHSFINNLSALDEVKNVTLIYHLQHTDNPRKLFEF